MSENMQNPSARGHAGASGSAFFFASVMVSATKNTVRKIGTLVMIRMTFQLAHGVPAWAAFLSPLETPALIEFNRMGAHANQKMKLLKSAFQKRFRE